ncbi:MAG: histidinol dehydrogenase [Chloroflexi bacterium]|nr:histidinol dehydrogenase [Chloroflexota bacterium]
MQIIKGYAAGRAFVASRPAMADAELPPAVQEFTARAFGEALSPTAAVERIVKAVRTQGDAALREYTERLDGKSLDHFEVSKAEIAAARAALDPVLIADLEFAAERIRAFHEQQSRNGWMDFTNAGALGQIVRPLGRVGMYAPGGRACYPSTVLMTCVPAKVAGVPEIVVCSPAGPDGELNPLILAAASVAGADRVFKLGGAQAIAAMAYGTETVPRVDKICGPGNLFVMLAKRMVFGDVGIDALQGPTEVLVVADDTGDPVLVAADLLAQAEHDELVVPLLITTSQALAEAVLAEIERQLPSLPRLAIISASLENRGAALVVDTLAEAIDLANLFAPEHLCLQVREPWSWISQITNAGGIFVGEASPEVVGDYSAGPSHVMPTAGTARFSSPLNVFDFLKVISVIALDERGFARTAPATARLAYAEGLQAHARAIELRQQRFAERKQNAE